MSCQAAMLKYHGNASSGHAKQAVCTSLDALYPIKTKEALMNFGLVGDGNIAKYHKAAIEHVGGKLIAIEDPKYGEESAPILDNKDPLMCVDTFLLMQSLDYIVICSPTFLHRQHILQALKNPNIKIIVEKPMVLPWEPVSDLNDDRINVVLQLRWLPDLPKSADRISVRMVRNEKYFYSWKGDARKTGGLFFNIFIHYIDLAIMLGANFEGIVANTGEQIRFICWRVEDNQPPGGQFLHTVDLQTIDMQNAYNLMYESIIKGEGVRPKDLYYLNWILHRNSEIHGYGRDGMNKSISIPKELL